MSLSSIYAPGNHQLCVLEFFKGGKNGIKENCQVEILTNIVLPQASVSDGIWALATQEEIDLSRVCKGDPTKTIKIVPHYQW